MSQTVKIRYNTKQRNFSQAVHSRVDQYFKSNGISKTGGWKVWVKAVVVFSIYLVPYFLVLSGAVESFPWLLFWFITMGLGMAFIGLAVMHDANHGSYSSNKTVNNVMSFSLNLLGGHYKNWQVQHNTLHHTFTNIEGHDEDIAPLGFLRFSPHAPLRKIHRFQFLYAWFFYGLMTVMWMTTKDFNQLIRFNKEGLLKAVRANYGRQMTILIVSKILYYAYLIALPIIFTNIVWWEVLLLVFIMHFVAGLTLALIFQPAHVVEDTAFPLPDKTGNMENDWAVHQLYTTANFAPRNRVLSWLIGGLNYQVEHHLFPAVSHVHYRNISSIVKETAKEFNYPYHSYNTFVGALASHARTLMKFGRQDQAMSV